MNLTARPKEAELFDIEHAASVKPLQCVPQRANKMAALVCICGCITVFVRLYLVRRCSGMHLYNRKCVYIIARFLEVLRYTALVLMHGMWAIIEVQENVDLQIQGLGLGLGLRGKCGSADPHFLAVRLSAYVFRVMAGPTSWHVRSLGSLYRCARCML